MTGLKQIAGVLAGASLVWGVAGASAAATPAAATPAAATPAVPERSLLEAPPTLFGSPDQLNSIRDPFRRPEFTAADRPKTELEMIPTDQFKMVGVVTGPKEVKAMLLGPNSKTYFVTEKTFLGTRNGQIIKIRSTGLVVREKVVNVLGQEEAVDVELALPEPSQNSGT